MALADIPEIEPGPLAPSSGLTFALRLIRAIGEILPAERPELTPEGREVALTFLHGAEKTIGATLPHDVIALATLRIPIFRRACGLQLAELTSVKRDCAGEFGPPPGWIEIGSFDDTGMRADSDIRTLGCGTLFCMRKGSRDRAPEPRVRSAEPGRASNAELLSDFLRERLARRYTPTGRWIEALERARDDERPLDAAYLVTIVDDRVKLPAGPKPRVRHKKFGEGNVEREIEGGKLEIAFDSGETRTLLRSFVEEL